jgi:hypothetical protein
LKYQNGVLYNGSSLAGSSLQKGYYMIQSIASLNGFGVGFIELFEIKEYNGTLVQLVDVWSVEGDVVTTKLYTSPRVAGLNDGRKP